jgi:hypothetical protein
MNESVNESGGAGPSHRNVEVGVAIVIAIVASIAIYGSIKVGVGWGVEGPRAGFFPFYVSLAVLIATAFNLFQIIRDDVGEGRFATWNQIHKVTAVVIPTAIYVFAIPYSGIYVASVLLIAAFMIWLGKYRWVVAIPVAFVVPLFSFLMFEVWFLVPLPKGPIENLLGY